MNRKQKGFSLIELLIVVAIILIIAAIAIPNLLRSKMAANEASAVGSVRTILTASVTYSSTYDNGFPPTLAALAPPAAPPATCDNSGLIDPVVANATTAATAKSGYYFTYSGFSPLATAAKGCTNPGVQAMAVDAQPAIVGTTGQRSFCTDQTGVIRFDPTGAAIAVTANGCDPTATALQ